MRPYFLEVLRHVGLSLDSANKSYSLGGSCPLLLIN